MKVPPAQKHRPQTIQEMLKFVDKLHLMYIIIQYLQLHTESSFSLKFWYKLSNR